MVNTGSSGGVSPSGLDRMLIIIIAACCGGGALLVVLLVVLLVCILVCCFVRKRKKKVEMKTEARVMEIEKPKIVQLPEQPEMGDSRKSSAEVQEKHQQGKSLPGGIKASVDGGKEDLSILPSLTTFMAASKANGDTCGHETDNTVPHVSLTHNGPAAKKPVPLPLPKPAPRRQDGSAGGSLPTVKKPLPPPRHAVPQVLSSTQSVPAKGPIPSPSAHVSAT